MPGKVLDDPLIDLIKDAMAGREPVSARRLFGGAGIYAGGICFALLSRSALYFKVSGATRDLYEAEGSKPFGYSTKGGRRGALTSYYRVPDRLLDDAEELRDWALEAISAARASKANMPTKQRASGDRKKPVKT